MNIQGCCHHILLPCAIVIKIILIITLINLFQRRANDLPDSAAAEARKDQSRTFHVGHRCHDKVAQEWSELSWICIWWQWWHLISGTSLPSSWWAATMSPSSHPSHRSDLITSGQVRSILWFLPISAWLLWSFCEFGIVPNYHFLIIIPPLPIMPLPHLHPPPPNLPGDIVWRVTSEVCVGLWWGDGPWNSCDSTASLLVQPLIQRSTILHYYHQLFQKRTFLTFSSNYFAALFFTMTHQTKPIYSLMPLNHSISTQCSSLAK